VLHDPSVALLEAAVNSDPNPTKGDAPLTLSEGEALVPGSSVPSNEEIAAEEDAQQAEQDQADQDAAAVKAKAAAQKKAAATKKAAAKKAVAKTSTAAKAAAKLPAVSGYFGNPLNGAGKLSQGLHGHNAVDIAAPPGTPIYAAASGTVTTVKSDGGWNSGYGNYVVISHPNGTSTLYAHMSSVATSGGAVSKGSVIGYVGRTGEATGNHLHFEVHGAQNPFAN
jgi:murein DD-endopeptidase MepM/ murein hydrolase activator NlpD